MKEIDEILGRVMKHGGRGAEFSPTCDVCQEMKFDILKIVESERNRIRRYLRREMKKIPCSAPKKMKDTNFFFCYGQAKFDTLMDIDRDLGLGAFCKKVKK